VGQVKKSGMFKEKFRLLENLLLEYVYFGE